MTNLRTNDPVYLHHHLRQRRRYQEDTLRDEHQHHQQTRPTRNLTYPIHQDNQLYRPTRPTHPIPTRTLTNHQLQCYHPSSQLRPRYCIINIGERIIHGGSMGRIYGVLAVVRPMDLGLLSWLIQVGRVLSPIRYDLLLLQTQN